MQAVSGMNQALAVRNAPVQLATAVAVAKEQLEVAEQAGDAVLKMLDQASQSGTTGRTVDIKV